MLNKNEETTSRVLTRPSWHGTLTVDNVADVVTRLHQLLDGKRYVWVAVNESYGAAGRPEVRFERLAPEKSTTGKSIVPHIEDPKHKGFTVIDTYGVWSLWTSAKDEHEFDDYKEPYIAFGHNRVTIERRAPAGHRLTWVIAVDEEL